MPSMVPELCCTNNPEKRKNKERARKENRNRTKFEMKRQRYETCVRHECDW